MKRQRPIKVIHNAPGKKGKLEYREFQTLEQVQAYLDRNKDRMANVGSAEKIARKLRGEK